MTSRAHSVAAAFRTPLRAARDAADVAHPDQDEQAV
jgi:hypothetical protein